VTTETADGPDVAGPTYGVDAAAAGGALPGRSSGFEVHLDVFEGPLDLLLGLISKHKLDVTEIALAKVTDEFVAWVRAQGKDWDLSETSEFLVVAVTLLDLKVARLLPSAEVETTTTSPCWRPATLFAHAAVPRSRRSPSRSPGGRHEEEGPALGAGGAPVRPTAAGAILGSPLNSWRRSRPGR
jgi:hypothetical protein